MLYEKNNNKSIYNSGTINNFISFDVMDNGNGNPIFTINKLMMEFKKDSQGVILTDLIDLNGKTDFIFKTSVKWKQPFTTNGYPDKYLINRDSSSGRLFAFIYAQLENKFKAAITGITQEDFLDFFDINENIDFEDFRDIEFRYNKNTGVFKFYFENNLLVNTNVGVREITNWKLVIGTETSALHYAYMKNGDAVDVSKTHFIVDGKEIF